jgi:lipopolysaccharide/colanic/teichoic acid biosynthesis glycosyltransferase
MNYELIKRLLDFISSFVLLIVLSPFLLLIGILVRIILGTPVIFKQERPGLNEKVFTIFKFRTMNDKKDVSGSLLLDSERLSPFGRFLRVSSLDELPELVNIFMGEMSFVGPRPLLVEYLPYYDEEQRLRHTVKPGLTGLAQINGRNALSWEDKFKYDVYYVKNMGWFLDCKILFLTVGKAVLREGVDFRDTGVSTKFGGND